MAKYTYKKHLSQKQIERAIAEYVQRNPPKGLPFALWQVSTGFTFKPNAKKGSQLTSTVTLKMNAEHKQQLNEESES